MVSLPMTVADASVSTLLPGATSSAYRYQSGYQSADSMAVGAGYWIKYPGAATFSVTGNEIRRDTITIGAGWNIIGSISTVVDTAGLKTIPTGLLASPLYGYDGGYSIAGAIEPAKAYWVKSNAPGKLILNSFVNKADAAPASRPTDGMAILRFTDADGHTQTLHASADATPQQLAACELPPLPPVGAFDIRFATQRSAASIGEATTIVIRGARYPLSLSWEMGNETAALLIDGVSMSLRGDGATTIDREDAALTLTAAESGLLPAAYALGQNYPNPFNPSTEIRFDLPAPGTVDLTIYDILGRTVATLVRAERTAGSFTSRWDALDRPSGIYVARLTVTGTDGRTLFAASRKLVLAK